MNIRAACRLFVVIALVAVGFNTAFAQDIQADTAHASDRSPTFRFGVSYASVWPLQYYRLSRFTFPYGGTVDLTFQPDANGPLFIGFRVGLYRSDEARGTVENIRIGEKYNYTELHSPIEIVMHQRTVEFQLMARYYICETRVRPFVDASLGVKYLSAPNEAFDRSEQGYFITGSDRSIGELHPDEGYTAVAGLGVGVTARLFNQLYLDIETRYEHGATRQNFPADRLDEWIMRFPEPYTNQPSPGSLDASDAVVTPANYSTKTNVVTAQIGLSYELRFKTKSSRREQSNLQMPKLP